MTNNDELERQAFEAVIRKRFGDLINLNLCANGDGEYLAWDAQVAWVAWKAGSKYCFEQTAIANGCGALLSSAEMEKSDE